MTIQPTTSPSSSAALSLSLPPATYAKLLPTSFLTAHLPSTRPSGRTPHQARTSTLHTRSLTHAHGSSVIRIGGTAVVCGIRGEILRAADTDLPHDFSSVAGDAERIAQLGLLVPNIELSTGCNPAFLPGNAPGSIAQGLVQRIVSLLRTADVVGLQGLCIYDEDEVLLSRRDEDEVLDMVDEKEREIKAYFTLYIDVLFLSLDGGAFDAAWLAILSALQSTKLPAARWDRDTDGVLCDPRAENYRTLSVQGCPVALSWTVFVDSKRKTNTLVIDPDDFEESCCKESGTVVVDFDGDAPREKILRLEKYGGKSSLGIDQLRTILEVAKTRWNEWKALLQGI